MAQWLRVRLLMQGHRFDPRAASERSPGATTTEPALTTVSAPHSLQLEKVCAQQQRPSAAKKKYIIHQKLKKKE